MNELINEITKLTDEWYSLIGKGGYYKEKDCHWYIETKWSYGRYPRYTIYHNGYILGEIEETWTTYDAALKRLKEILEQKIKEEKEWLEEDESEER
jgi:hypothetical protein